MSTPALRPDRRVTAVTRALTYGPSTDEVLDIAVDYALDSLHAQKAVVMLADEQGLLRLRASRGVAADLMERFREPLDESIFTRIEGVFGAGGSARFLGVPLVLGGRVIGLLAVDRNTAEPIVEEDEWLLSAIADQIAVALEGAHQQEVCTSLRAEIAELERVRAQTQRALQVAGHDLRTPLSALQGYLGMLSAGIFGPLEPKQLEVLDRVQLIGRHFAALIDNVLQMAQLAAQTSIPLQEVNVDSVIEEAVSVVSPLASAHGVDVRVEAHENQPAVYSEPDRLRQVLLHLLDNAVKYTPAGGEIVVRCGVRTHEGREWATLEVADSGPGIPPERAEDVFDPGERLQRADMPDPGGSGLGLSIARNIMQLLGGRVVLVPDVDRGAVFRLWIPLLPPTT